VTDGRLFESALKQIVDVLSTYSADTGARTTQVAHILHGHLSLEPPQAAIAPAALMRVYSNAAVSLPEKDLLSLMVTLLGGVFYGTGFVPATSDGDLENSIAATCPACGQRPHYAAYSSPSGTKTFECSFCYTQWPYSRLKCPHCGNLDAESLGYFSIEGLDRCRVQFCSQCLTYHKVFDLRDVEGENHLLYLHHLGSLLCDTMACREGFTPCSGLWWNDPSSLAEVTDEEESL
jgi:hypothetical protein